MLDSLVLDRCLKGRNIEIQALASQPFRPVLIEGIRIVFSQRMEQRELMFPFGLDDAVGGQLRPNLCALQPPVCFDAVFFLI